MSGSFTLENSAQSRMWCRPGWRRGRWVRWISLTWCRWMSWTYRIQVCYANYANSCFLVKGEFVFIYLFQSTVTYKSQRLFKAYVSSACHATDDCFSCQKGLILCCKQGSQKYYISSQLSKCNVCDLLSCWGSDAFSPHQMSPCTGRSRNMTPMFWWVSFLMGRGSLCTHTDIPVFTLFLRCHSWFWCLNWCRKHENKVTTKQKVIILTWRKPGTVDTFFLRRTNQPTKWVQEHDMDLSRMSLKKQKRMGRNSDRIWPS